MPSKFPDPPSIMLAAVAAVAFFVAPLGGQQLDEFEPIGDVVYGMKRDAMTDEEIRTVLASSQDDDVTVTWSCREGRFSATVNLNPPLAMEMVTTEDGNPEVQYRIDKEDPVGPVPWSAGEHPSQIATDGEKALTFTNDAREGSTLAVRVWNAAGDRVMTRQLSIDGLSRALEKLPCFVQME